MSPAASGRRRLGDVRASIASISWSPDGKYLAAGNDRSTVVIWEIASGSKLRSLYGHTAAVQSVDWNPDSVRLASGGADGTIRIWNAHTAKTLTVLAAPSGPVRKVHWHPDGKHLLATCRGRRLQRSEDLGHHKWPGNRWLVEADGMRSSARMGLASPTMTVRSALGI